MSRPQVKIQVAVKPTQVFLLQARCYGKIQRQLVFLTEQEANAFRDECVAYEATRPTEDEEDAAVRAEPVHGEVYLALQAGYHDRHPWASVSHGTKFVVKAQTVGRPVKGAV